MKVSIIVPVYNVEKYISKCLDSLVNQTLKDIEIILVDDGSSDNSKSIIEDYAKKYPNIRYFFKENGGQGSARNLGLEYATGEYISFIDSDDYVDRGFIKKMYDRIKTDHADVVICGQKVVDLNGRVLDTIDANLFNDKTLNVLYGNMGTCNKLYKKDILKDIRFREKVWYEDIDFIIKVLFSTEKISFIDEPLYNYLFRPGSTMNNKNYERNIELLYAFDSMLKYFKEKNLYNAKYHELEFIALYHIYLMGISRISRIDIPSKYKRDIINKYREYMYKNFPNFKKNEYIKYMTKKRKFIYVLINLRLYNIIKLLFRLRG